MSVRSPRQLEQSLRCGKYSAHGSTAYKHPHERQQRWQHIHRCKVSYAACSGEESKTCILPRLLLRLCQPPLFFRRSPVLVRPPNDDHHTDDPNGKPHLGTGCGEDESVQLGPVFDRQGRSPKRAATSHSLRRATITIGLHRLARRMSRTLLRHALYSLWRQHAQRTGLLAPSHPITSTPHPELCRHLPLPPVPSLQLDTGAIPSASTFHPHPDASNW
mmetsp:Transcript_94025/g.215153  ORF Transcript_94025/g.215153 Transcript_94025/m.215153 type:complete len:218 (-) Transcript_94025:414-1067(-)